MKQITRSSGPEVRGKILTEDENEYIVQTDMGKLIVHKSDVIGMKDVLDCESIEIGSFIRTPDGVYLKIEPYKYRLVKGHTTLPIDTGCLDQGEVIGYSDVFDDVELPATPTF